MLCPTRFVFGTREHLYSNFNSPTSLQGFEKQSTMVGVGILSRNFKEIWYNYKWNKNVDSAYRVHVAPIMMLEKTYIYQLFILLKTRKLCDRRSIFPINYVLSLVDKIDVELKRAALERCMKENQTTSADDIIAYINEFSTEVGVGGIDPAEEGTLEDKDEGMQKKTKNAHYRKQTHWLK